MRGPNLNPGQPAHTECARVHNHDSGWVGGWGDIKIKIKNLSPEVHLRTAHNKFKFSSISIHYKCFSDSKPSHSYYTYKQLISS